MQQLKDPSVLLLLVTSVAVLLFVFLIVNTVLCCHYRKRHALLIQQSQKNQSNRSNPRGKSCVDSVNLTKVTTYPARDDDSQKHRCDRNLMMSPVILDSLKEDQEPFHGEVGPFSSNGQPDFRHMSRIYSSSFDSSSTSSEETFKDPHRAGETTDDEGPVYSPVSPETDTSSGDDYDDVDV